VRRRNNDAPALAQAMSASHETGHDGRAIEGRKLVDLDSDPTKLIEIRHRQAN